MGPLALVGSGEFTDSMLDVDRFLLKQIKNPKVAILPTAAGQEKNFQKWIEDGVNHFKKLKAVALGVNLISKESGQDPKILKELEYYNFYYFSGGDPNHLLSVLKDSPAWNLIYQRFKNGSALAGSSAGAMVFGQKVWDKVYDFDKKGKVLPWEQGLNLVDFGIIPHANVIKNYFNDQQIKKMESNFPKDIKIVGIDEDTAYINIKDRWSTLGKGQIHDPIIKI